MSVALEVHYPAPVDKTRERRITAEAEKCGGVLTFYETPSTDDISQAVIITCEFSNRGDAEKAAESIRFLGEHVEGPMDYD